MPSVTAPVKQLQAWIDAWPRWPAARARRAVRPEVWNREALASYLCGILSPLPLLGLLFGVAAVVLGFRGLHHDRREPGAEEALQCWIGIGLGAVFSAFYLAVGLFLIAALY